MRVLYIAGNPDNLDKQPSLLLEGAQVSDLGVLFQNNGHGRAEFLACPDVPLSQIRARLKDYKPDVVHLAAHGHSHAIMLRNEFSDSVEVTAETLRTLLDDISPALVYLDCCDSGELASSLVPTAAAAIGFHGAVPNFVASQAARHFYDELLSGKSIEASHQISAALVSESTGRSVQQVLHARAGSAATVLLKSTRILCKAADNSRRSIHVGVTGFPADTALIVLTMLDGNRAARHAGSAGNDRGYLEITLGSELVRILGPGVDSANSVMWTECALPVDRNCRIAALVARNGGKPFLTFDLISTAVERYLQRPGVTDAASQLLLRDLQP